MKKSPENLSLGLELPNSHVGEIKPPNYPPIPSPWSIVGIPSPKKLLPMITKFKYVKPGHTPHPNQDKKTGGETEAW